MNECLTTPQFKRKRGFPIKKFQSGLHIIQIILLHIFDVSTIRLNRYILTQIMLLHDFDICISTIRLNRYVIQIILLEREIAQWVHPMKD